MNLAQLQQFGFRWPEPIVLARHDGICFEISPTAYVESAECRVSPGRGRKALRLYRVARIGGPVWQGTEMDEAEIERLF